MTQQRYEIQFYDHWLRQKKVRQMTTVEILPCINPGTGAQFDAVAMSTPQEVTAALAEMRRNQSVWQATPVRERAHRLKGLQQALVDQADEITRVVNQDTGKSRQDALAELFMLLDKLQTYRRRAPKWLAPQRVPRGIYLFKRYYSVPRPFGVAAIIGPWNYPLDLTIPPAFAALLAGNTVILKPSEVTPAVGRLIERIFQGLPQLAPYVRVLHGDGAVGERLVAAGPDVVFLTGSAPTAQKVAATAAKKMTPLLSELGGKDAMIVLEDADLRAAARWGVWGSFVHAGQACVAVERVYVVQAVYDAFLTEALAETERLRLGYSPETQNLNDLGPLTFQRQADNINAHLQEAQEQGARILVGGGCDGLFMEPTVVVDVHHGMKLMREETFGPVMPIMQVRDEAEAIRLANDSPFGLSASVWSNDLRRAERVAQALEVGSVVINDALAHYAVPQLPFGGRKMSGSARTHGQQDVLQFTQLQSFAVGPIPGKLDVAAQLRQPNNYHLMRAMLHALFGVSWAQRARLAPDLAAHLTRQKAEPRKHGVRARPARGAAFAGLLTAFISLLFVHLRGREKRS